jgi:hypothetical protein
MVPVSTLSSLSLQTRNSFRYMHVSINIATVRANLPGQRSDHIEEQKKETLSSLSTRIESPKKEKLKIDSR